MDDNNENRPAGIKVIDRRRFDSEGEEKIQPESATTATPAPAAEPQQTQSIKQETTVAPEQDSEDSNESDENPEEQDYEGDISFGSFVISMATQALMLLGQIKPPDGIPISVDPQSAKQTIDILSMLDVKTKGNLDAREAGLLKDALHNLRVAYLRFS
jgi:hypothetical protein